MGGKGQIWIETVIYTLIGLVIIGLVLAVAQPKLEARKDRIFIEQSIEAMKNLNDKIFETSQAVGNRRIVYLTINKGSLEINSDKDMIVWKIFTSVKFSEPGQMISLGAVNVSTAGSGGNYRVDLIKYFPYDISYGSKKFKKFESSPTPIKLSIENKGINQTTKRIIIEIKEV